MLYHDHGLNRVFTSYEDYFGGNVDDAAVAYLQAANDLARVVSPGAVTIAEDVSGMPGMARPVAEGGLGFDYRLNMGVPDYWTKLVKETPDEEWPLSAIYHEMVSRRPGEKRVGYVESHDQSLVGDKTLAFQLMDQAMYFHMGKGDPDIIVERGIALLKLIRLLTFSLAGEAWLSFLGNEFGHPEWVDFPRTGNGFSYHHARRQWSLADNPSLRYSDLSEFDRALQSLDAAYSLLPDSLIEQLALHEDTKQLVYRRGPLVFAFNFHPTQSHPGLRLPIPDPADYQVVLDTDDARFGGWAASRPARSTRASPYRCTGAARASRFICPAAAPRCLHPSRKENNRWHTRRRSQLSRCPKAWTSRASGGRGPSAGN